MEVKIKERRIYTYVCVCSTVKASTTGGQIPFQLTFIFSTCLEYNE